MEKFLIFWGGWLVPNFADVDVQMDGCYVRFEGLRVSGVSLIFGRF